MRSASEILDEIRRIKGLTSDTALGEVLGVKQTTVASWRGRNSIPYDEIVAFCVKEGLSIDKLLIGSNYIITDHGATTVRESASVFYPEIDSRSKKLLDTFNNLDDKDKQVLERIAFSLVQSQRKTK